jgi:SAM-dependent methyltransferase
MFVDKNLNYGRKVIDKYISKIGPLSVALDIGAGEGLDLQTVLKYNNNCKAVAVEPFLIFQKMLKNKGITPISIDIERDFLPIEECSVDLIIMNQVLEHIKDIFWVLHNVSLALKNGGHLIIGVPNLSSLHNRLLLALGLQPTSIGNHSAHIRGYTYSDVQRLFNLCAPGTFDFISAEGANFYPFPPFIANPLARLWSGGAVSRFYLLKKVNEYDNGFIEYPVKTNLNTRFFTGNFDSKQWT